MSAFAGLRHYGLTEKDLNQPCEAMACAKRPNPELEGGRWVHETYMLPNGCHLSEEQADMLVRQLCDKMDLSGLAFDVVERGEFRKEQERRAAMMTLSAD